MIQMFYLIFNLLNFQFLVSTTRIIQSFLDIFNSIAGRGNKCIREESVNKCCDGGDEKVETHF